MRVCIRKECEPSPTLGVSYNREAPNDRGRTSQQRLTMYIALRVRVEFHRAHPHVPMEANKITYRLFGLATKLSITTRQWPTKR